MPIDAPGSPTPRRGRGERWLEQTLFASRWLAAPIYLALALCLIMLLFVVAKYAVIVALHIPGISLHQAVLATIGFIDIALVANLVILVIFSGYENFVSKLEIQGHADRPDWMGTVDYSGLKRKLLASIVAITAIELLKAFMTIAGPEKFDPTSLRWLVVVHLVLLLTAVLSSLSDYLSSHAGHPTNQPPAISSDDHG